MAYILTDGAESIVTFPYNIGMLRRDNPNTSFPASPSDEMLASWKVFPVTEDADPTYDPLTQSVALGTPVTADGGVTWTRPWIITDLNVTEQETKLASLQAIATAQQEQILSAADQYVVTALVQGKALTPEFEAYRAAIVDLENLPGYPTATVFPAEPPQIFSTDVNTQVQVDLASIKTNSVTFNDVDPTMAAITFADGSTLSTKPGNVSSDLTWANDYWGGDQSAPLAFFNNSDLGNNSVSFDHDKVMGRTSFGLTTMNLNNEFSGEWLRADRIMSYGTTYTNGVTLTEGVASIYSGSYQHAYSWSNYNIARRKSVERITIANYANDFTIGITNTFSGNFQGHYTTKYYIENGHASGVATVVGDGITLNEVVALPTINPGETWMVEIEVYTDRSSVPHFSVINTRQVV